MEDVRVLKRLSTFVTYVRHVIPVVIGPVLNSSSRSRNNISQLLHAGVGVSVSNRRTETLNKTELNEQWVADIIIILPRPCPRGIKI